jgi:hypothetical protein
VFALIWLNRALDELADIYVAADPADRARMAAAVEALNARLQSDPLAEGESREGSLRITFISTLAVSFHVSDVDQVVRVIGVQRYGK